MNLRLIRYSIWSRAWVAALALIGASFICHHSSSHGWERNTPRSPAGSGDSGCRSGALVFNDSGVVAAATCVFPAATTLAVLALEYRLLKHNLLAPKAHVQNDADGH